MRVEGNFPQVVDHYNEKVDLCDSHALEDLREITAVALPVAELKKLGGGETLLPEEEGVLLPWIEAIQRWGMTAPVEMLEGALRAINSEQWNEIAWQLVKRGCQIFEYEDCEHREWIDQVVQLGQVGAFQLGEEQSGTGVRMFAVVGQPDKVVLFGRNRADLGIRMRCAEEKAWGIPCGAITELCENGRYAVMTRPSGWLREIQWKTKGPVVALEDKKSVDTIARMLRWFMEERTAPKELSIDDLYIGEDGNVYSICPYQRGFLDSVRLERFLSDCARGNRTIYRHIFRESGLTYHPGMQFLQWVVYQAAAGDKFDIAVAAADRRIGDGRLVALAQDWYDKARRHPASAEEKRILADLYPPKFWR